MIGLINVVFAGDIVAQTDDLDDAKLIVLALSELDNHGFAAQWKFSEGQEATEFFAQSAVSALQAEYRFEIDTLIRVGHCLYTERVPRVNSIGEVWCGDDYLGRGAEKTISFDTDFPNS